MKNLLKDIDVTIQNQLSEINHKITGIVLLEILKYKIIDSLISAKINLTSEQIEDSTKISEIKDQNRKLFIKIISSKSQIINLNTELDTNLLFICINETININIEDHLTKKKFNYKCIPFTGIVLSEGSKYSVNYGKRSVILEIRLEEKNIEKSEENTI